jgi:hypothetical protein
MMLPTSTTTTSELGSGIVDITWKPSGAPTPIVNGFPSKSFAPAKLKEISPEWNGS